MKDTLVGIDKNIGKDSLIGIISAVSFIILGSIFSIISAIGIPSIPASLAGDIGKWLIIVIAASIFETFFFFEFVLDFFDNKLINFGINLSYFFSSIIVSLIFALFHFTVYSGSLLNGGGSFFSASVVAFGWCYMRKWTKSLLPVLINHSILNAWILAKLAIVIG